MTDRLWHCIADPENPFLPILKAKWAEQGFQLITAEPAPQKAREWLLFAPYRSAGRYLAVETYCKRYLAIYYPQAKLAIIGTVSGNRANYWDIFQLPDDPGALWESALSVNADWVPVASYGVDILKKIHAFVDGHSQSYNPDQSVREVLSKIRKGLGVNRDALTDGDAPEAVFQRVFESDVARKFEALEHRWKSYAPYLLAIPFSGIFAEMDRIITQIRAFFDEPPVMSHLAAWIEKTKAAADLIENNLVIVERYVRT